MRTDPDPQQLRQFLALVQHRSFRLTAEQLGVSQSALTKSVQRLEKQLGCRLFDRTTRTVSPTAAALALRPRAEEALRGLSAFTQEAGVIAGSDPAALRVGSIALATESVVVPALARFAEAFPETHVELVVGSADVYEDLASGQCDLVVGDQANFETSPYAQSLRVQPLRDEPLVALFRADHPAAKAPDVDALLQYPWAIPSRYFAENQSLQVLANRVNPLQFPRYKMTSLNACIALASAGRVITLAPLAVAQGPLARGLAHHDLGFGLVVRVGVFTLARVSPTSAVRGFQQALALGEG